MAISLVTTLAAASSKTSQSIWSAWSNVSASAGDFLVLCVACDNADTLGNGPVVGFDTAGAGAFTVIHQSQVNRTAGASANDGTTLSLFVVEVTAAWSLVSLRFSFADALTLLLAVTAKAASCSHFSKSGTLTATRGQTVASGAAPAAVGGLTTQAGDLVVGATAYETNSLPTGDTDTTDGSWSTISAERTTGGSAVTNQVIGSQWKIVTGSTAQSYQQTGVSADHAGAILTVRETAVAAQSAPPRRRGISAAILSR